MSKICRRKNEFFLLKNIGLFIVFESNRKKMVYFKSRVDVQSLRYLVKC